MIKFSHKSITGSGRYERSRVSISVGNSTLDPNRKHSRVSQVANQRFNSIRLIDFDKKLRNSQY
jgi:hypothetical protein